MYVGSNAFPAGVEEESNLLRHDAVYVGTHTCLGDFHIRNVHLDTIKVLFIHQLMH